MFKRTTQRLVWWPVTVNTPIDGGRVKTQKYTVQFELLKQSELDAVHSDGGEDAEILQRVVRDWKDYADDQGNAIAFSAEALAEAIDVPFEKAALVGAFLQASNGREAARKN